ncbi:MAG: Tm-1-like ATP-binding domain-containing protein [Bacteroidota bacterium]
MIYIIGTIDTKGEELAFLASLFESQEIPCQVIDVSTQVHSLPTDISQKEIASYHEKGETILELTDRGQAITFMSEALSTFLSTNAPSAVLGIGGSGGTSLICKALRELPIGIPKLMVSTVASGNTRPYIGASDICMLYTVSDLAGLNSISRKILSNAAHAIMGMVKAAPVTRTQDKSILGMTMFGVTTPCIQQIREQLKDQYDCMVFHATGIGGQSMEKLIDSGLMEYVIDITLTEVCDHLMGGVLSAGETRLDSIVKTKIPYIGSVGALDMVNFGPIASIPASYKGRNLYVHNPQVTLMRTTPEENQKMGVWISQKLNQMEGPVRFFLPEKGLSLIDAPGKPFYDPEANAALFRTLKDQVQQTDQRVLISLPYAINDPEFSQAIVETFNSLHA